MLEKIIQLDRSVLVYLNSLGSSQYDYFWLFITKQLYWTPYFLILLVLIQKKIGWKKLGILLLFITLLITFTDQATNLSKNFFQRLRPCNDLDLNETIRVVKHSYSFSFFSGHASNSMATMTFVFLLLRKYYKYTFLVFLFPLIFAYSRIYLGLHFPLDILVGYLFGFLTGNLFYKLFEATLKRYSIS